MKKEDQEVALAVAEGFWGDRAGISVDFKAPEGQRFRIGLQSDEGDAFGVLGMGATWEEALAAARKSSMGQKFLVMKEIYLGD